MTYDMPDLTCPACNADIEPDLLERTGKAECPFCGADLSDLDFAPVAAMETSRDEGFGATQAGQEIGSESAARSRDLSPLPAGSKLQIAEASADRLVFYIPAGGKQTAGLGCFALAWNGFMCVFTPAMLFGMLQKGGPPRAELLGLIAFLSLFWAVGIGMLLFWIKMKFERTFVLLDRKQIAIQRILFGKKRIREFALTPASQATLETSYRQNDVPVYHVAVPGASGTAKFGTPLSNAEKDWLVARINEHLGKSIPAGVEPVSAVVPLEPLRAESIPADDLIEVEESHPNHLRFRIPAVPKGSLRWWLTAFTFVFGVVWMGFLIGSIAQELPNAAGPAGQAFLLFEIPFFLAGLVPLLASVLVFYGSVTVDLTRERLRCKWGVGNWGFSRSLPTDSIECVAASNLQAMQTNRPRRATGTEPQVVCVVRAGSRFLFLTLFHPPGVACRVAALVRTRLEDMGIVVQDA